VVLLDGASSNFSLVLLFVESDRIQKGLKSAEEEKTLDIEGGKPIKLSYKVTIPTEKYPEVELYTDVEVCRLGVVSSPLSLCLCRSYASN